MKTKMVQIRNVPEDIHAELCRRAKARRQSLSAYLLDVVEREAERQDPEALLARIRSRGFVELPVSAADIIAEERAEREARIDDWIKSSPTPCS